MTYHMICYVNRQMFSSIMDSNCMTNHCGYNGRCP
ncbi:Sodium channel protein type 11 subunit alpha [Bienertia sinuspersici]